MKWCEEYQCWCADVDDVVDPEDRDCMGDCDDCDACADVK